jgi:hypothetical protein
LGGNNISQLHFVNVGYNFFIQNYQVKILIGKLDTILTLLKLIKAKVKSRLIEAKAKSRLI